MVTKIAVIQLFFCIFCCNFASPWLVTSKLSRLMPRLWSSVDKSHLRPVPSNINHPDYSYSGVSFTRIGTEIPVLDIGDMDKMRRVCILAREVLDIAVNATKIGMTTDAIDEIVHKECIKRDCYPSPLNYNMFPKSVCTSVNEVVCHGIPGDYALKNGDIINIDVTVYKDGFHGDLSETVLIGTVSNEIKRFVRTAYQAMMAGISQCRPGAAYSKIGEAIEDLVMSRKEKYSIARGFCGHGVGRLFHDNPMVLHHRSIGGKRGPLMAKGHAFTVEPILCMSDAGGDCFTLDDRWTEVSKDGSLSAQFEHTLLITDTAVEILTKKLPSSPKYFWES